MNEVTGLVERLDKRYRYTYVRVNNQWVRTTVMKEPKKYLVLEVAMAVLIVAVGGFLGMALLGVV